MESEVGFLCFLSASYPAAIFDRVCYGIREYYAEIGGL